VPGAARQPASGEEVLPRGTGRHVLLDLGDKAGHGVGDARSLQRLL